MHAALGLPTYRHVRTGGAIAFVAITEALMRQWHEVIILA